MDMKTFTIIAKVDCVGVYQVEAEDKEKAIFAFHRGECDFSHYSEEMIDEIVSVEED